MGYPDSLTQCNERSDDLSKLLNNTEFKKIALSDKSKSTVAINSRSRSEIRLHLTTSLAATNHLDPRYQRGSLFCFQVNVQRIGDQNALDRFDDPAYLLITGRIKGDVFEYPFALDVDVKDADARLQMWWRSKVESQIKFLRRWFTPCRSRRDLRWLIR